MTPEASHIQVSNALSFIIMQIIIIHSEPGSEGSSADLRLLRCCFPAGQKKDGSPSRMWKCDYRDDLPLVLKNLSFSVLPEETVWIVGRTGSGTPVCLSDVVCVG